MAIVLVLLGGALARGMLAPLPLTGWVVALALVLLIRPVAGWIGLTGLPILRSERATISFFGIRGIASLYYLSHGLNEARFPQAELMWAVIGAIVTMSVVVHGVAATPILDRLDDHRDLTTG